MKKLIKLISITLLLLTTACSKTYTCGCTDGTDNVVFEEDINAENKSEAQEKCRSTGDECALL
jgi:hypothetical protein